VTATPSTHSSDRPVVPHVPVVKRRAPQVVLTLLAALLVGNGLIGERGLIALLRADGEQSSLSIAIGDLRAENSRLREDVRALREEPRTIEDLARSELGLIRPGERLFIVSAAPDSAQSTPIR
jgi:cell division protein FtsB